MLGVVLDILYAPLLNTFLHVGHVPFWPIPKIIHKGQRVEIRLQ
jgi:hypothetical protein